MSVKLRLLPRSQKLKNISGFTLLELMVVVTIAAILMAIAIPSFNEAIRNNRLTTYANNLVTAMNLARSEAIKQGMPVTVRRVDNLSSTNSGANWEDGWDVFTDVNGNGAFNAGDILIRTYPPLQNNYTLRGNAVFPAFINFTANGQSNGAGIFMVCDDRDNNAIAEANTSRLIMVNALGRVMMGIDTDNNSIPNDPNNGNADSTDCTP